MPLVDILWTLSLLSPRLIAHHSKRCSTLTCKTFWWLFTSPTWPALNSLLLNVCNYWLLPTKYNVYFFFSFSLTLPLRSIYAIFACLFYVKTYITTLTTTKDIHHTLFIYIKNAVPFFFFSFIQKPRIEHLILTGIPILTFSVLFGVAYIIYWIALKNSIISTCNRNTLMSLKRSAIGASVMHM